MVRKKSPSKSIEIKTQFFCREDNLINRYVDDPQLFFKSKSRRVIRSVLHNYFKTIEADPETYFKSERDYATDVTTFIDRRLQSGKASKTVRGDFSMVKCFLEEHDIDLPKKFIKRIGKHIGSTRRIIEDIVMSKSELKDALQFANVRMKAITLIETSSGMRGDEVINLKWENIDFRSYPIRVDLPKEITKTNEARTTFISNEAKDALLMWKKEKYRWQTSHARCNLRQKTPYDANKIFQCCLTNVQTSWRQILKKAGLGQKCPKTGRVQRHMHMHRAYFRTQLAKKVPVDIVEALMGHHTYLSEVYRRYNKKELGEFYLKGMGELMIYTNEAPLPPSDTEIRSELDALKEQMKQLLTQLSTADDISQHEIEKIAGLPKGALNE